MVESAHFNLVFFLLLIFQPQDPLRAVIGCLENPTADPTVFSEVIGAQSTTLDSRNG